MTIYQVQHLTRFRYSQPVSESVIEVQMQPRSEGFQRCLYFHLHTQPQARINFFADYAGNIIHFFDIPGFHQRLTVRAESFVEIHPGPPLPQRLDASVWEQIDASSEDGALWDMLNPSERTQPTELLMQFAQEMDLRRRDDPLTLLRQINSHIFQAFEYEPESTQVDSPIDDALRDRKGVCQDYAHIMIALARSIGIPCRYVSGYLFYQQSSDRQNPDASHAWIEAFLPPIGWVGFDPTNNILAGERHIRVALGRDYNDVPPTKGIFKGTAESELDVEVFVSQVQDVPMIETYATHRGWTPEAVEPAADETASQQQQQQQ
ncbi:transglutaminase family protein [Kamptonema cortianum]|nr:transglutaminase family protein [Kamptonema cortianum]